MRTTNKTQRIFSKNLHLNSIVCCEQDLVDTELDGETVILSIKNGKYYGLNMTSSCIWGLLKSPQTIEKLCQTLMEAFLVEQAQCFQDVYEILTFLKSEKLISVVNE